MAKKGAELPKLISADLPGGLSNIAAWGMRSSNGATKYEIVLWNTGHISCDCPGWTFKRKDNVQKFGHERWCKHLTQKWDEATEMFAKYLGNSRRWQVQNETDDNEPDVIPRVKAPREPKPTSDPDIPILRPTRAFNV
jgi:hypothetical protein